MAVCSEECVRSTRDIHIYMPRVLRPRLLCACRDMLCMEWTVHVCYACGHPLHKVTAKWKWGVDDDDACY